MGLFEDLDELKRCLLAELIDNAEYLRLKAAAFLKSAGDGGAVRALPAFALCD